MSTLGHKRTYAAQNGMSALPPESGPQTPCCLWLSGGSRERACRNPSFGTQKEAHRGFPSTSKEHAMSSKNSLPWDLEHAMTAFQVNPNWYDEYWLHDTN